MQQQAPHYGIRIDKIQVGSGFAGVVFTVGTLLIFLIGVPALWYFLAGATSLGVGVAALLRLRDR